MLLLSFIFYLLYLQPFLFFSQRISSLSTVTDTYCKTTIYLFIVNKKRFIRWLYSKTFNKDYKDGFYLLLSLKKRLTRKTVGHTKYQLKKIFDSGRHNGTMARNPRDSQQHKIHEIQYTQKIEKLNLNLKILKLSYGRPQKEEKRRKGRGNMSKLVEIIGCFQHLLREPYCMRSFASRCSIIYLF